MNNRGRMFQRHTTCTAMIAVTMVCLGLMANPIPAWPIDQALITAAEKEGQLTVYGCDPPQTPIYTKRFMELYPKIKVTSYVAGCWDIYNRNTQESAAGKQIADVFFALEDVMTKLQRDGSLLPYKSKELVNFPESALRPDKDYSLVKTLILVMTTNSQYMKGIPDPSDWKDFISSPKEWHNKITFFDPRTSSAAFQLLASLSQNFGKEETAKIYRGLRAAGAELASQTPAGVTRLVSGEKPIMFYIVNNHLQGARAKGAPLSCIVPKSGSLPMGFAIAAIKNCPNPNAARLFIEFMLTDCQKLIASKNEYALRRGSPAPEGLPIFSSIKFMKFDIEKALNMQDELIRWWQDVTQIQ